MTADDNAPVSAGFPLLLRPRDAANVLAISPRKLLTLTACGVVPCVRIGRAVRYDPADLRGYIASLKGGPGQ